ncbi:DUF3558 domain-containing protein [Saccharopolyspora sp. 6V]|uniref:DUF3558 domain-containing protein n=1 Tax=Saccharopolyspora sp. 6V TaxID=2877239 RepID=UPI001CD1E99C|nr:DUF3558 domain-containing protein [Saccharopolyspora sp. 6V]MCA1192254.1 DUF3558 domain-containing protein [Saccharopolyspora sp. 6V]
MNKFFRSSVALVAGVSLLGLSGCALGGSTGDSESAPPSASRGAALEGFDPCTFFKPEELTSYGVSTQAEDFTLVSFQPGCAWNGEKMDIALQKNADETVESLEKGGSYDKYTRIKIAGRDAARMIAPGFTDQGGCVTVVSAGDGIVLYQLTAAMRDSVADPCGEMEKIANQTASRLPE